METNPFCSVLMSVYNGGEYLREAIDSILNQTYTNFEFIIIDDASTDESLKIIQSYDDARIRVVQNNTNVFLAKSLNIGIEISKGKYIIRMDADDISLPQRIEKQVTYMEGNPQIGFAGSGAEIIGYNNGVVKYEEENNTIKFKFLNECHFLHPAMIIRKEVILAHNLFYAENFKKNQDYELFARAIEHTAFGNLPEALIKYRQTKENIKRESHNQKENKLAIQKMLFNKIGLNIEENEIELYGKIVNQDYTQSKEFIADSYNLLRAIEEGNEKTSFFEKKQFRIFISQLFENVCRNSKGTGYAPFKFYLKSSLFQNYPVKIKILLILVFKNTASSISS